MNSIWLACLVFLMCAAIAGIGPDNEVAQFWNLLMGGSRGREQVMEHEHVLCIVLLVTFLVQDLVPLELERRLAMFLFGPNLFGVLLVLLFCLFDTSVDLYDLLENGEFTRRSPTTKTEDLLISATNLVLVIAHIKIYKLRYALNLVLEERESISEASIAWQKAACDEGSDAHPGSSTLLGRPKEEVENLRFLHHNVAPQKDI